MENIDAAYYILRILIDRLPFLCSGLSILLYSTSEHSLSGHVFLFIIPHDLAVNIADFLSSGSQQVKLVHVQRYVVVHGHLGLGWHELGVIQDSFCGFE